MRPKDLWTQLILAAGFFVALAWGWLMGAWLGDVWWVVLLGVVAAWVLAPVWRDAVLHLIEEYQKQDQLNTERKHKDAEQRWPFGTF